MVRKNVFVRDRTQENIYRVNNCYFCKKRANIYQLRKSRKEKTMYDDDQMLVFAGTSSQTLTARICDYLHIPQGKNETLHFSDGNTFVRILENVRGRRVYIIQATVFPSNEKFMELLFWI